MTAAPYYPPSVPGSPNPPPPGSPLSPFGGASSPFAPGGPGVGVFPRGPTAGPTSSFLSLFGSADLSLQEIADKAHQLQHKIDENAEQEKASLRTAAEQKHLEIERHAAELARHAASSIEAYKTVQLQTAERQKAYQQAVVRQQAEQAKRLIDQQAAQAIAAVETRDRQLSLQRQQQELVQRGAPQFLSALGGPLPGGPPLSGPSTPLPGMPAQMPSSPMGSPRGGRYRTMMPPGMGQPPPMSAARMGESMIVGPDRNRDGIPDMLQAPPSPMPMAAARLGDSVIVGADRNRDGIPDSMQVRPFSNMSSQAPPGGVPSMHSMAPRPGSPMPYGRVM